MSVSIEAGLHPKRPRSDGELQAALVENNERAAPFVADFVRLNALRDARFQEYIAPLDKELKAIKGVIGLFEQLNRQIEDQLIVNRQAREAEEEARVQAELQRLAEERRRVFEEGRKDYITGLGHRLTGSAAVLEKDPAQLSQALAGVLKGIVDHNRFEDIVANKIHVRSYKDGSMSLIMGEAETDYFLGYNPSARSQARQGVREITAEAEDCGDGGKVIRDFIGINIDTKHDFPVVNPFVLVRQNSERPSRMFLPILHDKRLDPAIYEMTNILRNGDISFPTAAVE